MTYRQERITPYGNGEEKSRQVETMFNNIAHSYDTLNHRLSFGIDFLWRKKAIRQLVPYKPKKILDIATGTGDFAIMSAKKLHPENVVGIDISEGMMRIGSEKVKITPKRAIRRQRITRKFRVLRLLVGCIEDRPLCTQRSIGDAVSRRLRVIGYGIEPGGRLLGVCRKRAPGEAQCKNSQKPSVRCPHIATFWR